MHVTALGYVGIQATDPKAWMDFAPEVLGLRPTETDEDGTLRFRMDARSYRIAIHPGTSDGIAYVGWEVPSPAALERVHRDLEAAGSSPRWATADECRARHVRGLVRCADVAGNELEFFYGQLKISEPFRPARPISGFVAEDLGLGHVVFGVADLASARRFYTDVLGFRISDLYEDRLVFLRCNRRHHSVALAQRDALTLRHIMLETCSLDDVGTTYDLCASKRLVTRALGRHTNDLMVSFYVGTPTGFEIEYGWGGRLVDDRTWSVQQLDQTSLWGHQRLGDPSKDRAAGAHASDPTRRP